MNCCRKLLLTAALAGSATALITGCVSRSEAAAQAHLAFIAGQNAALRQQEQQEAQTPGVTVVGPVQQEHVPWVAGLTLAQAVATANYLGPDPPKTITIVSRQGLNRTLDANALLRGATVPLQPGDVIELH